MKGVNLASLQDETSTELQVFAQIDVPRKYKVMLLNDDYTPMDFVVQILRRFFHMSEASATQVMLQIHILGKGICGTYTRDVAETLVEIVNAFSREHEHPLLCTMEPE